MRGGLFLAYWPWFTPEEQLECAVIADEAGLDSVWVAEGWGQDVVSLLGFLAGRTERVALGSGLMQIPARKPTATAMAACTIDVLSHGRMRLGLGLSGPQVSEGWYGVPFGRPLARTREYVDVVRRVLAGEKVQLPLESDAPASGLGKPLRLLARPVQQPIPIYLGAIGPRAIAQVGEIADGWLPFLLDPAMPELMMGPFEEGLAQAGRPRDAFDVAPMVPLAIAEDRAAAREKVRPIIAFYLGGMGHASKNFYVEAAERYGHGESARAVQERFLAGDRAGAGAALSDELIDAVSIATDARGLDERLAAYERAGADTVLAIPCGEREDKLRAARAFAAALG